MTSLKAFGKYLIIRADKEPENTKSGIFIPESQEGKPTGTGEIISVSDDYTDELQAGQRVHFAVYAPTEIKNDDEKLLCVDIQDILAVIEED